jgi:pilus assembly protein FimV
VEEPWYKKTWLLAAAGVGLLAVVVIGLLGFLRKPKKAPAAAALAPLAPLNDEEHELLDRLALQPDDTAAHLELVSLYYARQEVEKFEDAAQAMYAHLGEHEAAEWEQVKAMGQELAPHNPLFAQDVAGHGYDSHGHAHAQESSAFDAFEDTHSAYAPSAPPPAAPAEDPFDFDLTDHSAAPPPPPAKPAPMEDFTLNMPAMDFDRDVHVPPARTPEPAPAAAPAPAARADDDFGIGSEDATGTKLDLAKAYLDMGDPEGARSMLEEVVAEGSAAQKAEANKLLKEMR